jgi:acyl-CoA reductase-like NAD-dependent aldehyde dehydrogenase
MELGGKDAAIVTADADIDVASSGVLWGSFFNAGQTCCSIERIYVDDSIADEFKDSLLSKLSTVRQGGVDYGSLTFAPQLKIVQDQVTDAVELGATVLAGGPNVGPKNSKGTLWYAPTVLENVNDEMKILNEETFGPVVTITRVRDDEEAIRRANEEAVNLTASVWSSSKSRADAIAKRVKAGSVGTNTHGQLPAVPWAPWGGWGESGYGRLNGDLGLQEFCVPVHVAQNRMPKMKNPLWYPYDDATENLARGVSKLFGARHLGGKLSGLSEVLKNSAAAIKNKL